MNLLCHQIFSGAAFAENQHRRIGRCNTVRNFKRAPHLRRAANHSAELPFSRQLAPQRRIFFFQSGHDPVPVVSHGHIDQHQINEFLDWLAVDLESSLRSGTVIGGFFVVLRLGGVELVLLAQRDDNLVDQRVAQAADLDPLALGLLRGGDL